MRFRVICGQYFSIDDRPLVLLIYAQLTFPSPYVVLFFEILLSSHIVFQQTFGSGITYFGMYLQFENPIAIRIGLALFVPNKTI